MAKYNLEPTEFVLIKVQQIYEMILVRHGFMLVGQPLGGKSVDYQVSVLWLLFVQVAFCRIYF